MGLLSDRLHARARFYDALAVALDAGLTADQSLGTLAGAGDRTAAALVPGVARGEPLSRALAAQGGAFDRFEVVAVEAGEAAGRLPEVLRRLGRAFAVRGRTRDRLVQGLIYPVILLHAAVVLPPLYLLVRGGLGAYLGAVVPIFALIYGALGLAIFLIRGSTATEDGKLRRDRLLLRLPGVSKAVRATALADYTHAFAILYATGVPMPETLKRSAEAARNRVFRAAGRRIGERVRRGGTLQEGFAAELGVFPQVFVQAVAVGEAAGKLEATLEKAEDAARQEAERATLGLAVTAAVVAYAVAALVVAWVVIRSWIGITRLPDGL